MIIASYLEKMLTSDVVWAAIIAAGLTLLGVTLSNRANRRSLRLQLEYTSQEKRKERELNLKKDIYLNSVTAIAEAIEDVASLAPRLIKVDDIKLGNTLLPAIGKIHMCGAPNTINYTIDFMKIYNDLTLNLIPLVVKYSALKQEILYLNNFLQGKMQLLAKLEEEYRSRIGLSNSEVSQTYRVLYNKAESDCNTAFSELQKKEKKRTELHVELVSKSLKAGIELEKKALELILLVRSEIDFQEDCGECLIKLEKAFNKLEQSITIKELKKLSQLAPAEGELDAEMSKMKD